jgi:hypothetical protein
LNIQALQVSEYLRRGVTFLFLFAPPQLVFTQGRGLKLLALVLRQVGEEPPKDLAVFVLDDEGMQLASQYRTVSGIKRNRWHADLHYRKSLNCSRRRRST